MPRKSLDYEHRHGKLESWASLVLLSDGPDAISHADRGSLSSEPWNKCGTLGMFFTFQGAILLIYLNCDFSYAI